MGRQWTCHPYAIMHLSEELLVKLIDGLITAGLAYIARVFFKVVQNVSTIPKMKQDLDGLYQRVRDLENGRKK